MNEWDNLPNAKHIDRVLTDLKAYPEEFKEAWSLLAADWDKVWGEALSEASSAASSAARSAARSAAWSAISTLIAWDHSEKYLTMTSEKLEVWYALSDDPAALLLMPYVRARELINEKGFVDKPLYRC
jgi:hypothetical protein